MENFIDNSSVIITTKCNHNFHKNCTIKEKTDSGIEEICPICTATEIQKKAFNKGKSLIKKQSIILDNERTSKKEFQVNVSYDDQNILKKLKKFDNRLKVKKRISIENSLST